MIIKIFQKNKKKMYSSQLRKHFDCMLVIVYLMGHLMLENSSSQNWKLICFWNQMFRI